MCLLNMLIKLEEEVANLRASCKYGIHTLDLCISTELFNEISVPPSWYQNEMVRLNQVVAGMPSESLVSRLTD
ncbi:hypothetical protein EGR_02980 [Echinococcus granulosus]|uniref:Uncharacterized protein n=1 Tax=Echinococcus granulosus TaxID=6210 RepID=W6UMD6_ECHGR|nr:hypothetical protein EGR_02980 [Echinococcus granulosus]EUB62228.1 hypothetical protein EGR_02980 [Echinococcus granulosus]